MGVQKEEMEGKGKVDPRFKEVHLGKGDGDRKMKRATCLASRRVLLLSDLVHITDIRGRNHQPHVVGNIMEGMMVLVLIREAAYPESRLLGGLSL